MSMMSEGEAATCLGDGLFLRNLLLFVIDSILFIHACECNGSNSPLSVESSFSKEEECPLPALLFYILEA